MTEQPSPPSDPVRAPFLGRRELLAYSAAFGTAFVAGQGLAGPVSGAEKAPQSTAPAGPIKRYDMRKSINMWAFPYPDRMSLRDCFQLAKDAGFDGIEVNFALEGDLSDRSTPAQIKDIARLADQIGIQISGVCSFLYWPYPLTHNDPQRRDKSLQLVRQMIAAAQHLGTENLLVVPGAVSIPWLAEAQPVPNDVCERRARDAIRALIPAAQQAGVLLNLENIFVNGFLLSPQELVAFVDGFQSPQVKIHFDTGNILQYQSPEHWIPILGQRIQNIHFKEWDGRTHEFNLHTFRPLLDGTTNWPAVMAALDQVGYRGYLTFEYFHPFQHWPEALVYQTSDALDRMLGKKT